MNQQMKSFVKNVFKQFGIGITGYDYLISLQEHKGAVADLVFLKAMGERDVGRALQQLGKSKAQLRQDLFVLAELDFMRDGFFVEFGATDGIELSNTYLLEKEFNWRGILAEPARCWQPDLRKNRTASIDFDCVWKETGLSLSFNEVESAWLSTLSDFRSKDGHADERKAGQSYSVNTVSLTDLLRRHDAPPHIDYLSIDTEGSEHAILESFDFDAYKFSVITCEHNFTEDRERIHELLTSKGYKRKFEAISSFDDWYVLR